MVACPSADDIVAFVEGDLPAAARDALHAHLDRCPDCRCAVAGLAADSADELAGVAADRSAAPDLAAPIPTEFDEYRLLRPLGRGAMGQVFLAQDTLLLRLVAIKWLHPGPGEAHGARFLTEARAIARLHHPNVVAIYRAGQWSGRRYLISEYVPGQDLQDVLLQRGPLPGEQVLRLALGLARGLGAAHGRGVLHRDLKPANIRLSEAGEAKLLDFGLAKLAGAAPLIPVPGAAPASDLARTQAGALVGTPLYMAPEVFRGEPALPASDIYSLGAVLYQMCCGHPPLSAASLLDLRQRVLHDSIPPIAARAPGLDGRLAALIDRCLRRDPAARFPTGDALAEALSALPAAGAAANDPAGNPYRGLHPFEAEHRPLFFGRTGEIRAVVDLLCREPVVVVAGDSGVGKSSLCRAGVLPAFADEAAGQGRDVIALCPGRRPLEALEAALGATRGAGRGQARQPPLIFIDQVEELWTLRSGAAQALLQRAAAVPGARLLLAVRGDFLGRLGAALDQVGALLDWQRGLYLLRPLSPDGLRDAIRAPAQRRGVSFDPELLSQLQRFGLQTEGGLPLLAFALAQLWEVWFRTPRAGQDAVVLPPEVLPAIGGVSGALARHADEVLGRLRPAERDAARRLLGRLVTPDGDRLRRARGELGPPEDEALAAAIEALVRGRLLFARGGGADGTLELAHESLLSSWGTLRDWLAGDRERRLLRGRVEAAAREWERLGRAGEALLRGAQLREAAELALAELPLGERAFVLASRRAQRLRGLWRAAQVGAVPVLLGLGYGALALSGKREQERKVEAELQGAAQHEQQARAHRRAAEAQRGAALVLFDEARRAGRDAGPAEQAHAQALARGQDVTAAYRAATHGLELALSRTRGGPLQERVRPRLAALLLERAEWAEAQGQATDDLLQRVSLLDEGGGLSRRFFAPARLRVTTAPPGVQVVAQRYQADRAGRTLGAPVVLGTTPLRDATLAAGSYLLTLRAPEAPAAPGRPGDPEVRYPILLQRGEAAAVDLRLPDPGQVPAGFVYIPAGRSLYGAADETARRGFLITEPQHGVSTGAYVIARYETTYAEYLRFLRALGDAAAPRAPRAGTVGAHGGLALERGPDGRYTLILQAGPVTYRAREGQPLRYQGRARRAEQDWLRLPVAGISCADAAEYAAWLARTGEVPGARLCTEEEWERAARGADDRDFPHGARLDPEDANFDLTYGRAPAAMGPDEVGSHPASRSPFGVDDLVGNVLEWTRSPSGRTCVARGGAFYFGELSCRSNNRNETEPLVRDATLGLRVCASVAAAAAPEGGGSDASRP